MRRLLQERGGFRGIRAHRTIEGARCRLAASLGCRAGAGRDADPTAGYDLREIRPKHAHQDAVTVSVADVAPVDDPSRNYGDRVVAVEPGGVEPIPLDERHGRPSGLFWTWVSPNMEFAT